MPDGVELPDGVSRITRDGVSIEFEPPVPERNVDGIKAFLTLCLLCSFRRDRRGVVAAEGHVRSFARSATHPAGDSVMVTPAISRRRVDVVAEFTPTERRLIRALMLEGQ